MRGTGPEPEPPGSIGLMMVLPVLSLIKTTWAPVSVVSTVMPTISDESL